MENSSPQIDPARLPELYEAVCQLHASLELEEVIDRALQAAIKLTGAERAFIVLRQSYGVHDLYALPQLAPADEQLIKPPLVAWGRDQVKHRQSLLIADTQNDLRFATEPFSTAFTSRTALLVPLHAPKDFLGILIADKTCTTGSFTTDDLVVLEALAEQATVALHNAQVQGPHLKNLADVAHELQTRMTSIRGHTDLVLEELTGPLTDEQRAFLRTVSVNAEQVARLLSILIETSRIEGHQIRLFIESVNVREYVEGVIATLQQTIQSKQHMVTLRLAGALFVRADPSRLKQVITILLDNALKYTPADGKIEVVAEREDSFVRLSVHDTGIGIIAEEQQWIFTKFFRSRNVSDHGYGLSLYIAKQYIELMGGTIGFESEPGKGSTFWFTLPIATKDMSTSP